MEIFTLTDKLLVQLLYNMYFLACEFMYNSIVDCYFSCNWAFKSCLNDIQVWMSENQFKLNPDKPEFIVFSAKDRHKWLSDSFPVNILGNCLYPTDV